MALNLRGMAASVPPKHRGTAAFVLVMAGSLGIQASTAILSHLFVEFSPIVVAGLRMGAAALILLVLVRPNPFAVKRSDWPQVIVLSLIHI